VQLTLLHDLPLVEHYFHPSGRRGLSEFPVAPRAGAPEPAQALSRTARGMVLAAVAMVAALFALDSTVVSVALPEIRDQLGGGSATIEWVSSIYLLTFAVSLIPAGRLADRFGPRVMFVSGTALYAAAALLGALAAAPWMLVLGRGAQGVGAGTVSPAGLLLVTRAFGADRRGWAIGLVGMLLGISSAVGPLVGGIFTDTVGWRAIFVAHGLLGAAAAFLLTRAVARDRSSSTVDLRLGSTAALAGVVLGIQLAIIEGRRLGWHDAIAFAALAAVSVVVFWRLERSRDDKVLDFSVLRRPPVAASVISRSVVSFAFFGNLFYLTLFLEGTAGYSAFQTGLILLPSSLAGVAASPFVGRLTDRVGPGSVLAAGTAAAAAGLFVVALIDKDSSIAFHLAPALILNGIGFAMVSVASRLAPLGAVPEAQHGRVTSLVSFLSRAAAGFGVTFATGIFHLLSTEGVTRALGDHELSAAPRTVDFVRGCLGVGNLRAHLDPLAVHGAGFPDVAAAATTVDSAFSWIFSATLIVLATIVALGAVAIAVLLRGSRQPTSTGS
jgi:EmrB/QacA subfamily drug resistance transporter